MRKRLKAALVGCGNIVGDHLDGFMRIRDRASIVVFCDKNLALAEAACAKYAETEESSEARATDDFESILADSDIDAVDLSLPHHLHEPMTVAAAKAGKHVLCEKPLGRTVEECDRMIGAAKEAGVTLMHLEPMRMADSMRLAAEMIRSGKLGRILGIQGTFAYWQLVEKNLGWRADPILSGGGHLMDGGIHLVDAMLHLGGAVTSVQAMTAALRPELGPLEDFGVVNLRYEAGYFGQMFSGHASAGRGATPFISAYGELGCLAVDTPGSETGLHFYPKNAPVEFFPSEHSWRSGYRNSISHFVDVVQNNATLYATPESGRENVRFVLAAYESAKTGNECKL